MKKPSVLKVHSSGLIVGSKNKNSTNYELRTNNYLKIGEASKILGVSIDTLRRWEKAGKIEAIRTPGGTRLFKIEQPQTDTLSTEELLKQTGRQTLDAGDWKLDLEAGDLKLEEDQSSTIHPQNLTSSFVPSQSEQRLSSNLLTKFLISTAFISVITLSVTAWISASYLTAPKDTQRFFKNNIASPLLKPFHKLAESAVAVISPNQAKQLGFIHDQHPPPLPTTNYQLPTDNVLAVTASPQFLEVNSDTQINGSLFVRDSINGAILEGTPSSSTITLASGGTTLTVSDSAEIDQDVSTASSPTFSSLTLSSTTNQLSSGGFQFTLPGATTTLVGTDTTQTLTKKSLSGSSNTFTNIPNSALVNSKVTVTAGTNLTGGGDVNLGSSVTLSIKGSPSFTGQVQLEDGTAAAPSLTFASDADTGLYRIGSNNIALITGGTSTQGISIDSSGNVGLGTISPTSRLHVVGTGNITGNVSLGGTLGVTGATTLSSTLTVSGNTNIDSGTLFVDSSLNRVGIGTTVPGSTLGIQGNIGIGVSYANAAIPANGLAVEGNVGIGTTSPDYTLDVIGTAHLRGGAGITGLIVAANGNVGIGITAPIAQFHVRGITPTQAGSITTADEPVALYVQGRYAYSVNSGSDTLQIFDVSNPTSPTSVGSVADGTNPGDVFVQGRYAYVVNSSSFRVYDISNPSSPIQVGSVASGAVTTNAIYIQGRYAYVVNFNTSTLRAIDISNPTAPVLVGSVSTGSNPRGVFVQGKYAYVVGNADTLQIFDISNPSALSLVGSVSAGTDPRQVYVQGRYAYVPDNSAGLRIFDISNPSSPSQVGSASSSVVNPDAIDVQGRYAYLSGGVNASGIGLEVFDISNPASPTSVDTLVIGNNNLDVQVQGRYVYLIDNNTPGKLYAVDVGGAYIQQLEAGGIETGTLTTRSNVQIGNILDVMGGLTIGSGGLLSSGSVGIGVTSADSALKIIQLGTGPTAIFSGGNVGIGATLPQAKLVIQGNLGIGYTGLNQSIPVNGLAVFGNVGIGITTANSSLTIAGGAVIGTGYNLTAPTNGLLVQGLVGVGTTAPGNTLAVTGGLNLGTYASFTGPSSGLAVSGNVGIGTTSPATALHIIGNTTTRGHLLADINNLYDIGSAAITYRTIYANEVNATTLVGTLTGGNLTASTFTINSDNATDDAEDANLRFYRGTSSTHALLTWDSTAKEFDLNSQLHLTGTITSTNGIMLDAVTNDIITPGNETLALIPGGTGNVGINTTSPYAKLQVKGAGTGTGISFLTTDSSGTQRLTILDNGNVGIGVTNPSASLTVHGNVGIGFTNVVIPTNGLAVSGNVGIGITTANSNLVVNGNANIGSRWAGVTAPSNGLLVEGNIGIANSAPNWLIHALGSAGEEGIVAETLSLVQRGSGGIRKYNNAVVPRVVFEVNTTAGHGEVSIANVDGTTTVFLDSNSTSYFNGGNLGIGITTANSTLSVAGSAHIGGIRQGISAPTNGLFVDGNVGIGATTSTNLLDVWGNVGIGNSLTVSSVSTLNSLRVPGFSDLAGNVGIGGSLTVSSLATFSSHLLPSADDTYDLGSNTARWRDLYLGPGTLHIGTSISDEYTLSYDTTSNLLGFNVNGSGASEIVFDSSGNVGIGWTSPLSLLSVSGNLGIGPTSARSRLAAGTYLATDGNVGIGITTANSALTVAGGVAIGTGFNGPSPTNGLIVQGNVGIGVSAPSATFQVNLNTSNPFVVTSGGNVGVGTTIPAGNVGGATRVINIQDSVPALFVVGSTAGAINLQDTGATSGQRVADLVVDGGKISLRNLDDTSNTVNRYLLSGDLSTGNIGIGTSNNNNFALQVNGSIGPERNDVFDLGSNTFRWQDLYLGPATLHIGTSTSDEYALTYDTTNNRLGFNVNDSGPAEIVMDSSGNLGIGTTNPGSLLTVTGGNVGIGTSAAGAALQVNGGGIFWPITTSITGPTNGLAVSGNVGIGITTANSTLSVAGSAHIGGIRQGISAPTNGLFVDGNVGIGATTSSNKLDVWGNARITGTLTVDSTLSSSGVFRASNGSATTPAYSFTNLTNAGLWTNGDGLLLTTGGSNTSGITVTAAGNVGIGITNPVQALSIQTSDDPTIRLRDSGADKIVYIGNVDSRIYLASDQGTTGRKFSIDVSAPDDAMFVNLSGNLGIGITSAPDRLLHVASTINITSSNAGLLGVGGTQFGISGATTNAAKKLVLGLDTTDNYGVIQAGNTDGTNYTLALNPAGGNVGIGTTSPAALLTVGNGNLFQVNSNGSTTITQAAVSGGQTTLSITPGAHTAVTAESSAINIPAHTLSMSTAGLTQRTVNIETATYIGNDVGIGTGLQVAQPTTGEFPRFITNISAIRIPIGVPRAGHTASQTVDGIDIAAGTVTFRGGNTYTVNPVVTGMRVGQITINQQDSGTETLPSVASLYIAGAMTAGAGVTLTNNYAFWVDDGTSRFDGNALIGYTSAVTGPSSGLAVSGNVGIGITTANSALTVAGGAAIGTGFNVTAPTNGLLVQGNVGIGFTTPDRLTQLASDINITSSITSLLGAAGTQFSISGSTADNLQKKLVIGLDTTDNYGVIQAGNVGIGLSMNIALNPGGGNIGIGTSSPLGIFEVNPTAATSGNGAPILLTAQQSSAAGTGGALTLKSGAGGSTSGASGGSLSLTGGNQSVALASQFTAANSEFLSISDNSTFNLSSGDFSFTAWVYLDSLPTAGNEMFFVSKDNNAGTPQREYGLLVNNTGGTIVFRFYTTNGGAGPTFYVTDATSFGTPSTGTWYFLTAIHNATTQRNYISVNNGTLDSVASTANPADGTAPFEIGRRGVGDFYTDGRIAGVGFWKKALNPTEIASLYNDRSGLVYAGLSGNLLTSLTSYWNLSESSGSRADSVGTNTLTDNATVTGANGPAPTTAGTGGALTLTGGTPGITGVGGAISLTTGVGGTTSGSSGALTLDTGTVTSGSVGALRFNTGGNSRMTVTGAGNVGIGFTNPLTTLGVSGNVNIGFTGQVSDALGLAVRGNVGIGVTTVNSSLVVNQGAVDTSILQLKSSDVDHGVTNRIESDTYGFFQKVNATTGGLYIEGVQEQGTALPALEFHMGATGDTTKSSSGRGMFEIDSYLSQPGGGGQTTANANIFALRENSVTRMIINDEGSIYMYPSTYPATNTGSLISTDSTSYLMGGNVGIGATAMNVKFAVQGNVGIGTSTGDTNATLTVVNPTVGGLPSSAATIIAVGSSDGTTAGSSIRAKGLVSAQQADFGEFFPFTGVREDYEYGDLVGNITGEAVSKTAYPYDSSIRGIVVKASAFAAGEDEGTEYDSSGKPTNRLAVALLGRVPLKVSTENGPIEVGDFLTSSSTRGVAMKAIRPGPVVGKALESFGFSSESGVGSPETDTTNHEPPTTNQIGKILVFVSVSYADPGNFFASLSFDNEGNLIVPKIKVGKLTLDPSLATAAAQLSIVNSQLSINEDPAYTDPGPQLASNSNTYDLAGKIASLEERLAALENGIAQSQTPRNDIAGEATSSATPSVNLAEATSSALATNYQLPTTNSLDLTPPDLLLATPSATLAELNTYSEATVSGLLAAYDLKVSNTLKSLGTTTLGQTTIAGRLTIDGLLTIDNGSEINVIGGALGQGILYLQKSALARGVDIFDGKVSIDKDGNIKTAGTITAKEIHTDKIRINTDTATSSATLATSAGTATLPAGSISVDVDTSALTENSLIFTTADRPVAIGTKVKGNDTFTISISIPLTNDLNVNWWIIDK